MPRNIFPLLFVLFPVFYYFCPSWPNLVDSVIAWGREHPALWAPLIRMYLAHLEILAKPAMPDSPFKKVCDPLPSKSSTLCKAKANIWQTVTNPLQNRHKISQLISTSLLSLLHQDLATTFVSLELDQQVTSQKMLAECSFIETIFAGIHMALSLKDRGYSDVVIFERYFIPWQLLIVNQHSKGELHWWKGCGHRVGGHSSSIGSNLVGQAVDQLSAIGR